MLVHVLLEAGIHLKLKAFERDIDRTASIYLNSIVKHLEVMWNLHVQGSHTVLQM